MKKLILLLIIVPMVSFGQGLFKKVEKKDEFGDVIGTKLQARAANSSYILNKPTITAKEFQF